MFKVELVVGHRRRDGVFVPHPQLDITEQQTLAVFSALFGGGQVYRRTGGYLTADGKAVIEPCSVIFAYAESVEGVLDRLWAAASKFAAELDQESVLIVVTPINGLMGFVGPSGPCEPVPLAPPTESYFPERSNN
jgi:hypothetical protein